MRVIRNALLGLLFGLLTAPIVFVVWAFIVMFICINETEIIPIKKKGKNESN